MGMPSASIQAPWPIGLMPAVVTYSFTCDGPPGAAILPYRTLGNGLRKIEENRTQSHLPCVRIAQGIGASPSPVLGLSLNTMPASWPFQVFHFDQDSELIIVGEGIGLAPTRSLGVHFDLKAGTLEEGSHFFFEFAPADCHHFLLPTFGHTAAPMLPA
jgi:hypothetical protein